MSKSKSAKRGTISIDQATDILGRRPVRDEACECETPDGAEEEELDLAAGPLAADADGAETRTGGDDEVDDEDEAEDDESEQGPLTPPKFWDAEAKERFGNGNGYVPESGDADELARIMFSEGADVPEDYNQLGWAVVNRAGPAGLNQVLQQTDGNGNYQLGYGTKLWDAAGHPESLAGPNLASFARARNAAEDILNGASPDPTNGATYFYSGPEPSSGFFPSRIASGRLTPTYNGNKFTFFRDTQK